MKNDRPILKSITAWVWLGRVAPLTALFILGVIIYFDFSEWTNWVLAATAILFGVVAFAWWWWVIYAVKDLNEMLAEANNKFGTIIADLREIKKEFQRRD